MASSDPEGRAPLSPFEQRPMNASSLLEASSTGAPSQRPGCAKWRVWVPALVLLLGVSALVTAVGVFFIRGNQIDPGRGVVVCNVKANEITIVHFNDVYQLDGVDVDKNRRGGFSPVAQIIQDARACNPDRTLVLFAGDLLSPSGYSELFQGQHMVDVMNRLHIDAASLGNHEFDFGLDILMTRIAESNFPWLNVNLLDSRTLEPIAGTVRRLVRDVQFGLPGEAGTPYRARVCAFGVAYDVRNSIGKDQDRIHFLEVVDSARTEARLLRSKENCTVVVALTHQFNADDCVLSHQLEKDIDFILGGHDHEATLQTNCGHAPFLKADSDLKSVWTTTARLRSDGTLEMLDSRLHTVTTADPLNPELDVAVESWNAKAAVQLNVTIGCTSVGLDAVKAHVRQRETNLGNFICDAMRLEHEVDVAIFNSGAVRGDCVYPAGNLTKMDVTNIHPYGNMVITLWSTGIALRNFVERQLSSYEKVAGDFLQVSGFNYSFDATSEPGSRVQSISFANGSAIDDNAIFTLAVTDFLYQGGPLEELPFFRMTSVMDGLPLIHDLYISVEDVTPGCIAPEVEGRIARLDDASNAIQSGDVVGV